ncbi:hypothetical protein QR680_010244 [Steinernema hermaphroditum]|uniref:Regulatory protein zeste n=1 Tax=Steinernema hermaphroditum TaxID=289476 RepID=A0AA39IPI6_9BILA|nr:hypothetical protein QR680_010244 [Steinernema hermaphroditum]
MEAKIVFLKAVQREKATLFGALSSTITAKAKEEAWELIRQELADGGHALGQKTWKQLRDEKWAYFKRKTMEKLDKMQNTGDAGETVLTEIDELVLAILHKECPTVVGLDVAESRQRPSETELKNWLAASQGSRKTKRKRHIEESDYMSLKQDLHMAMEARLIELVQQNSLLYDKANPFYNVDKKRERTWTEIAQQLAEEFPEDVHTAKTAKTRWSSLRTVYSKKKRMLPSGSSNQNKWIFFDAMRFLDDFMEERKSIANMDDSDRQPSDDGYSNSNRESADCSEGIWTIDEDIFNPPLQPAQKRKRKRDESDATSQSILHLVEASNKLNDMGRQSSNYHYGMEVASILDTLPLDQQIDKKRRISCILYEVGTMMKKCMNCRSPLVDKTGKEIGGVQCPKCKKNQEKYGKPGICKYCKLTAAFVDEKCVHCCHGERKFGPPVECNNCKLKSAFVKNGIRSDKAILCRLCDMTESEKRQKDKDNNKSSSSKSHKSSSSKTHSSSKHGQSTSKPSSSHHNKRASTGSASGQPPAKVAKQAAHSAGNDEQILLVQQLKSDVYDLETKLKAKDQVIVERDKKIADLNADILRKETTFKTRQQDMQKRFDDQTEMLNEKIRSLQKQLTQAQKQISKMQPNENKVVLTTVIAATAPPSSTKRETESPIALEATS